MLRSAVLFGVLVYAAACTARPREPDPGARVPGVVAQNTACGSCHAAIAAEWRASNHAEAFRHDTFRTAYALEPLPFCVACHAPEADAEQPRPPESDLGVACTTCHGQPHGADAAERARSTCAGCHEFNFPGSTHLLQKTVSEHRAGDIRASCTDCHMARRAGHTDHRFSASRDPELLRAAAVVTATRTPRGLLVRFERAQVGHAFPTGDLFRRLRVLVTTADGQEHERVLTRVAHREPESDTRPFADGKHHAELLVPLEGAIGPVSYRVLYERVAHPLSLRTNVALVDGAVEIAQGRLDE